MPACNKRFGVMRGVCSQKVLWEFERSPPAGAAAKGCALRGKDV